ncbi:MAG: transposase [Betaproteobacteria bacterium]|nr:transposase [Betaproteobacteria bacterium]
MKESFNRSHGVYGAPRVFLDLREAGEICSKNRVERLMRENGIRAKGNYRYKHQPSNKPTSPIPYILNRQFEVTRPNFAGVTDIT